MLIAPQTCLALTVAEGGQSAHFTAYVVGNSRWGLSTTLPQILQQVYTLPAGTRLVARFLHGRTPVQFETYILGYQETTPPTMVVSEPRDFQHSERRQALRLPFVLPLSYVTRGPRADGEKTVTVDIGVGGVGVVSTLELAVGSPVTVFLNLGDGVAALEAQVAWCGYRGRIHMTGMSFRNLSEASQRSLACFMFGLERQLGTRTEAQNGEGDQRGR